MASLALKESMVHLVRTAKTVLRVHLDHMDLMGMLALQDLLVQ
jgi:hypothetical protein